MADILAEHAAHLRSPENVARLIVEVCRYETALRKIQQWDCLNPPRPELLADLPWLKRLVDEALTPASGGTES